jgi:hypothetical protein
MKIINQSKVIITTLIFIIGLTNNNHLNAQSFNGFQSTGQNSFFFSLIWQGQPMIGFGYAYRVFSSSFTDIHAEMRFPLNDMYKFTNYEIILGAYGPLAIKRTFLGVGMDLRFQQIKNGDQRTRKLSLAMTAIPSYTYAASTNSEGIYGTTGIRITYAPVLFANVKNGDAEGVTRAFSAHKFEGGLHFDLHTKRTPFITLNTFVSRSLYAKKSILDKDDTWTINGDFYFGTYYLIQRNK